MTATKIERIDKCRSLCQVGSDQLYSIGPFFKRGLTVFKQQVRALNLIHAIHTSNKHSAQTMAVIGGGVSGVTAAAAAIALGWEVHLFEQRPVLCHLQHGCDTRWLHPHIYDWPQAGSEDPYAGLPLLNWKEGTAATVTEQIMTEFEEIAEAAKGRLHRYLGATTLLADKSSVKWDNSDSDDEPRGGEREFGVIVLAVGFGVESGVHQGSTPSYWRNDSVNQPRPGITSEKPDLYFVTGTGDGGLIDLLRCRMKSFNQGRIIDELVNREADAELRDRLRQIVEVSRHSKGDEKNWLFNQYDELNRGGFFEGMIKRIKPRLRQDTAAILNGRERTFSEVLSLGSASMFNTLLTYLLYQLKGFTYVYGEVDIAHLTQTPGQVVIGQGGSVTRTFTYDHLTIRHGANRDQTLLSAGLVEDDIKRLKEKQTEETELDTIEPLWPAGWWSSKIKLEGWSDEPIEFVPPATITIATTFVSTLSDVLTQQHQATAEAQKPEFRITLHRLLDIRGEIFFQQSAYYRGTRTKGSPGRVFEVETGLVGLVCRRGIPIVARKTNDEDFKRLWKALSLTEHGAKPVYPSVKSILGCPFFAQSPDLKYRYVCLVLFMDSEQVDFFTKDVLKTVFAASAGFVRNLEETARTGDVRFAEQSFCGYKPKLRSGDNEIFRDYEHLLRTFEEEFQQSVDELTFRKVTSFDAELQLPKLGRERGDTRMLPA